MEQIKEVLVAVMTVSFVSGVILILCPDGNDGIKKTLGFVCSAVICASLISPLAKAIKGTEISISLPSGEEAVPDADVARAVIENASALISSELEAEILRRYGQSVTVTLELDASDVSSVVIVSAEVSGEGELRDAADYVSETLSCPCLS